MHALSYCIYSLVGNIHNPLNMLVQKRKDTEDEKYIVQRGEERPLLWMQRAAINPPPPQDAGIIVIDH